MRTALTLMLAMLVIPGCGTRQGNRNAQPSAIRAQSDAIAEHHEWGTFYTYYSGESYGTTDALAGVAVLKPGFEIHPPHQHAEEEYLTVMEGEGLWHLNGREQRAVAGDMLYAAPWDFHGVRNTGTTPLRFVVWKWNSRGVKPLRKPE